MRRPIVISILVVAPLLIASAPPRSLQQPSEAPQQGETPQQGEAPQEGEAPQQSEAPQEGEAPQQEAGAVERQQPIPEGEIPSRSDIVAADLRRIETLLEPAASVSRIESSLDEGGAVIVELLDALDQIDPDRISTQRLADHRLHWLELRARFNAWASVLQQRFAALQAEREELAEVRAQWEATAETAVPAELDAALLRRIDDQRARVIEVEAAVRARRNAVGAIAARVATNQELVGDALQRIDASAARVRSRLLERNATPIWRSVGTGEAQPFVGAATEALEYWAEALGVYLRMRRGRLVSLLTLFAVVLLGTSAMRRKMRAQPVGSNALGKAGDLIARPFSLALAFTLVVAVLALPAPVGPAVDVLMLLAAVPVIRLGLVLFPATARGALYGVTALSVVSRLSTLGRDDSEFSRVTLLLLTALAMAGAAHMALRSRPDGAERRGRPRLVLVAASGAAILLGVALGANVFGWLAFAKMVADATVVSAFAGLAWAVFVGATAALIPALLDGRLGSALPGFRRNQFVVAQTTTAVVAIAASVEWAHATLIRFQVYEPLRGYAVAIAGGSRSIGGLTISASGILGAILILVVTKLVARLTRFVLREEVLPRFRIPIGAGHSVISLANYTVYGIGIVGAASAAGLTSTQVTVVIGALGVGIGFGLQNIVNNFVSGLILIFERPIKVGDRVETAEQMGTVVRIGIRASTIRRFDGAEISVPNGTLLAGEVINWTRSDDTRRIEVQVGVAYGTDPAAVLELLLRVAGDHELVLGDPEPTAQMLSFGDSSLDFRLRCWTRMDDFIQVASDLHVAVNKELATAGITIPFPQRDVHLQSTDTPEGS